MRYSLAIGVRTDKHAQKLVRVNYIAKSLGMEQRNIVKVVEKHSMFLNQNKTNSSVQSSATKMIQARRNHAVYVIDQYLHTTLEQHVQESVWQYCINRSYLEKTILIGKVVISLEKIQEFLYG